MIHSPIEGSNLNPPAKLYKRYTVTESVAINDKNIIEYEKNYYKCYSSFRWADASEKVESPNQPISGFMEDETYLKIKYNGKWKPNPKSLVEPSNGDIITMDGEKWMIGEIQRTRNKSFMNFATVYLSLVKLR